MDGTLWIESRRDLFRCCSVLIIGPAIRNLPLVIDEEVLQVCGDSLRTLELHVHFFTPALLLAALLSFRNLGLGGARVCRCGVRFFLPSTVSRDRLASNRLEHRGKVRSRRVDSSISPLSVPSTYPRSVSRTLFLAESSFTQPRPYSPRRSVNIDAPAPVVCHAAMSLRGVHACASRSLAASPRSSGIPSLPTTSAVSSFAPSTVQSNLESGSAERKRKSRRHRD